MTPEGVIVLAARHHVASESPLFNQQLVAFAAAIEAATIERCSVAAMDWCLDRGINANVATELDDAIRARKEKT